MARLVLEPQSLRQGLDCDAACVISPQREQCAFSYGAGLLEVYNKNTLVGILETVRPSLN